MEKILNKSKELGIALRDSDIYKNYIDLSKKINESEYEMEILKRFIELTEEVSEKERNMQPVEVYEKDEYQAILQKIEDNDLLKNYISAQRHFFELMQKVEEIIGF